MKTVSIYLGLLFFGGALFLACQKDPLEINESSPSPEIPDMATISLAPSLDPDILQESDITPMPRANNLILTQLKRDYNIVIIKKTDQKWVIDTLITGKLEGNGNMYSKIDVYATTALPVIKLSLRPGTYKAGFFFNANEQNWNPDIKSGFIVSEKEDITPQDELPYAYTYFIQNMDNYLNYNQIMLNEEPFAGWTSFTIQKNDSLQQTGVLPRQKLTLKRKATRFRYLLKNTKYEIEKDYFIEFGNTNHFFKGQFNVSKETPFCQGLNLLGGGYYPQDSTLTSVMMYISTSGKLFTSQVDHMDYFMCIPANSTYRSYYLLMDEYSPQTIDCEITNILITAQQGSPMFVYDGSIQRTFKLNQISGIVFEVTPEIKEIIDGIPVYKIKEVTDADAVGLFGPYFELNPNL